MAAVSGALSAGNVNLAGGSIYEDEARYLVRTLNEFEGLADIGATQLVDEDGRRVYVRDVAEIHWGHKERESIVRTDGHETVELRVYKEGDANTVQVARSVRERLDALEDEIPDDVELTVLFDQSSFIEAPSTKSSRTLGSAACSRCSSSRSISVIRARRRSSASPSRSPLLPRFSSCIR